jgi:ABC-type multidrug transport system permease subunit
LGVFRHRPFLIFWIGACISNTGNWTENAAQSWAVTSQTIGNPHQGLLVEVLQFADFCPVLLLALLALPYLFAALSLGILISSKANSQAEAMQLAFLPILPSVFFSGYIFPRETMPAIFKPISYMIPATYFINITRGVILRGATIKHLWTDGLALVFIGTVLLILAARRFQKKVIMA